MSTPNLIVVVTDDQGYGDLSCMGSDDVRTPQIDELAATGARLTDWYANGAVCSPTRASLLTGRYPERAGVRTVLEGHRAAPGLPLHVPTLATALRGRGYRSYLSGKWHLGAAEAFRPHAHGFDRWFGHLGGCIDYFSHIFYWGMNKPGPGVNPVHDLWEDNETVWRNGRYMTELITEKALEYVREAVASDHPFFLYLSYNAPHYPMHAPERYLDRFAGLPWDRQVMAAMLAAADEGIGEVMAELDHLGVRENTCTFFTSDNGPSRESRNWLDGRLDPYYGGSAGKLRGHKGSLYEGGIRVPGIVNWPGRIPAGQVLDGACATMDVFPTLYSAAGGDPSDYQMDGVDILPYLADGEQLPARDLFWARPRQTAIRRGRWKLVLDDEVADDPPAADAAHLADLATDMAERHNLSHEHPALVDELTAAAQAWRKDVEQQWEAEFAGS